MPTDDDKTLSELEEALAADYAMNAPLEELEADLARRGIDPARIAARARELAVSRSAAAAGEADFAGGSGQSPAKSSDQDWRTRARERLTAARAKIRRVAGDYAELTRDQLLARLEALRTHPSLSSPVVAAFRKRDPAESSDDDLRAMLADMESLVAIAGEVEGDGDGVGGDGGDES
jgi:hypothetical protein